MRSFRSVTARLAWLPRPPLCLDLEISAVSQQHMLCILDGRQMLSRGRINTDAAILP